MQDFFIYNMLNGILFVRYLCIMRLFFYIGVLFFSLTSLSQDLESRFYTITDNTLPKEFALEKSYIYTKYGTFDLTKNIGINEDNYWKAVSIVDASTKEEAYLNRRYTEKKEINSETLGFRKTVVKENTFSIEVGNPYNYGQSSRFRNSVYRDASALPFYFSPYHIRSYQ